MKKLLFFFIFINNSGLFSQNIDETIILADKMFEKKEYFSSLNLYKRAIFFSKENKNDLFLKVGDCYFEIKEYVNAIHYYDSLYIDNFTDEIKLDLVYKKANCFIFLKDYTKAEDILLSNNYSFSDVQNLKNNFYLGLIYFLQENFDKSEQYFINSISDSAKYKGAKIHKLFENKNKLKNPNPKLAGILSLIIPGSGQLYAGDYKNAINSFLLVAVFVAIGADMYLRFAYYDSLITVFPWFYRYYRGGYKNAIEIAKNKKTEKQNKKLNEIIKLLQTNE